MIAAHEECFEEDAFDACLGDLLGGRFSRSPSLANQYLATEGHASKTVPWGIAQPVSDAEVQAIHRLCSQIGRPMIPYGSGSSVEGQIAASENSLLVDLRRLDRLLEVDPESMTARVQSGITRLQLDHALRDTGLFFPVDPGADATLGGMAATRASGTNAVRYGTMRDNTLALTVVLADGSMMSCGSKAAKTASGYDLLHLFVGSEGTLGTITELTLRLHPRPEAVSGMVFGFPDLAGAVGAATEFRQSGIPVARVELFDGLTIRALNRSEGTGLDEAPTLLVELHGSPRAVEDQEDAVAGIARAHRGEAPMRLDDADRRRSLWNACHKRYYACRAMRPGCHAVATDICVPISRLVEVIETTQQDMNGLPFPVTLHGHVGDGNFHTLCLLDPASADESAAFRDYSGRLVRRALSVGGTCSGEHGIGIGKQRYLEDEHGDALPWMRRIKQLFDPLGIMNPGKNVDIRQRSDRGGPSEREET